MLCCACATPARAFPKSEVPRIFDRFHRVAGARGRTHEGTGIGLALVKELIELHKGTVSVESVVDKGTTFTVRVPFGRAHLPQDRLEASRTQASTATGAETYVSEALRWLPNGVVAEALEGDDEPSLQEGWPAAATAYCSPMTMPTCGTICVGSSPRGMIVSPLPTVRRRWKRPGSSVPT